MKLEMKPELKSETQPKTQPKTQLETTPSDKALLQTRPNGDALMNVVMITLILSSMSVLMFNFVLPDISAAFQITTAQVSWITSVYGLIYGIGTVIYGKLADRYKLKNVLTFGLLIFAAGSLVGLASQTFWMVLAGRCLQAAGAAAIPTTAMLIPLRYFPPERRGSAMSKSFVGLAIGSALGPIVAALIVSTLHWRWLFCVSLLTLALLPFYRKYLGEEQRKQAKLDWLGGILLGVSVTLFLLGITEGTWQFGIGGLVAMALFVWRICTAEEPFVKPQLFRNKRYSYGLMLAFLASGIGYSLYFTSPLLFGSIYELPSAWIAFAMVPAAAASALLGRKGGRIADAKGNATLYSIASLLLITCFVLMSTFLGSPIVWIAVILVLGQVGQTFIGLAMANSISQTLVPAQSGVGMGLMSLMNFISGSIATGIYGKFIDLDAEHHWNPLNLFGVGPVYSNLYLVLAALHIGLLIFYTMQFGPRTRSNRQ